MPNKVHARMRSYDLKGKFDSAEILRDWRGIATHNKTYEGLSFVCNKIENAIHNKNMDLAEIWLEKAYVRLKKISARNPISKTEFTKFLDNKYRALEFTKQLNKTAKAAGAVMKYEGVITKSIKALKSISELSWSKKTDDHDKTISQLKRERNKLKDGYDKMKVVMNCINVVGEFAPAGMSEMIEFNTKAFEAAGKAVKIAYDHAGKLEKRMAELDKEIKENNPFGTDKVNSTSGRDAEKFNDLPKFLDMKFKNRHYRGK